MDVACKPSTRGPRIPGDSTKRSELVRSMKPDVHYRKLPRSTCALAQISPDDGSFGLQAGLSAQFPRRAITAVATFIVCGNFIGAGNSFRRWKIGRPAMTLWTWSFRNSIAAERIPIPPGIGLRASVCSVNKFGYIFAVLVLLPLHYGFDIFVLLLLHSIHGAEQCWI